MKTKQLFLLNKMNVGGTEKAFLNYLNILSPAENDITLLLLQPGGDFFPYVPSNVKVKFIGDESRILHEITAPPLSIVGENLHNGNILRAAELFFSHAVYKVTNDRTCYYRTVLSQKYDGGGRHMML